MYILGLGVRCMLTRVNNFRDLLKELHNEGDCSKLSLGGRGWVPTAGMVSASTSSGVSGVQGAANSRTSLSCSRLCDLHEGERGPTVCPFSCAHGGVCVFHWK